VERDRIAAVRQECDRHARVRNDTQERHLSDRAAVVTDHDAAAPVEDRPAEAPVARRETVAAARDVDLRLLHRVHGFDRDDPVAVGRSGAEVQPGEAEDVGRGGADPARRARRPREPPGRSRVKLLSGRRDVTHGRAVAKDLLGQRRGVCQAEWLEEPHAHGRVPDLAGHHLGDAAEDREARVAVGHRRSERVDLSERRTAQDVLLERVVAATGVGKVVTVDPARVCEQVPDRHRVRDGVVGNPELGEIPAHRRVQFQEPFVDELHCDRRRPHLRDRPDLEQRLGRRVDAGIEVEHAGRDRVDLVALQHGERRSRHTMLRTEFVEALLEGRAGDHAVVLRRAARPP
jgi:hypothetical protein